MSSKFKFIIVSKNDEFQMQKPEFGEMPEIETVFVSNNTRPLADIYNENIAGDFDYFVFMHADVKFDVAGFIEHVESVAGKYDVLGLCGCADLNVSASPLNWFTGSGHNPYGRWGCVTHGQLKNQTSFFSGRHPQQTDHEAACIDGLCIVFTRKAVDSGMRFDSSVGAFNCYDTDISLQTVLNYKLKLGVIVRKDLMHYSVGKQILDDDFLRSELLLRNKWKFEIPKNSKLETIAKETSAQVK